MDTIPFHQHTGVDSPQIRESDLLGELGASTADSVTMTAGESITADDIVCLKPIYTDYVSTKSAYVYQNDADTNYGSTDVLKTGKDGSGFDYATYIEWDMSSLPDVQKILKAEMRLYVTIKNGTPPTQNIKRPDASWDESTITHNNAPSSTDDIDSAYLSNNSFSVTATGYITLDITQLVRHWKSGNLINRGIRIEGSDSAGNNVTYASDDNSTEAYRPTLRVYSTENTDTKIYRANCDDYLTCRSIIGIAQSDAVENGSTKVQYGLANIGDSSHIGSGFFLDNTDGQKVYNVAGLERIIRLGKIISASQSIISVQLNDVLIEKYDTPSGTVKIYVPEDVSYAIMYFKTDTASADYWIVKSPKVAGINDGVFGRYTYTNTFVWSDNYITVTPKQSLVKIYFYT